jgi:hypothetical protein
MAQHVQPVARRGQDRLDLDGHRAAVIAVARARPLQLVREVNFAAINFRRERLFGRVAVEPLQSLAHAHARRQLQRSLRAIFQLYVYFTHRLSSPRKI